MTETDPTTAPRIRAHYTGPFGNHTMLFHGNLGTELADLMGDVQDFLDQARQAQYDGTVWDTAEFAAEGSPLFFPIDDWTPIVSESTITSTSGKAPSAFVQFGGRDSTSGTRVKLYLFETYLGPVADMRLNSGENAVVDAVIAELSSVDNNISNIAGRTPIWYNYANVGQNDHLTHKARS